MVESLEEHLDLLIETSRQIGIMASNFQQNSQTALNQKLGSLATCLRNLDAMKDNFAEIKVPVSVFNYIDDGKNPLLYTKDCLMKTLKKNEEIKGKIVTFKSFREQLLEDFSKSFPEEYQEYSRIREQEIKEQMMNEEESGVAGNQQQTEDPNATNDVKRDRKSVV